MAVYGIGRGKAVIPLEIHQESAFGGGGSRGGSNNGGACHKCNQNGHFARECPQGGGGISGGPRGGGGGNCYKCGQPGHRSAQCPGNDQNSGGGGFNSGSGGGFNSGSGNGFNSNSGGDFGKNNNDGNSGGFGQSNINSAFGDSNGGFGGDKQRGGFGGAGRGRSGGNNDLRGGGFGESSGSGFGQSDSSANGFGGGFSGAGGGSSSNDFGGGSSSGRGCRTCGQEGHFARECPNGAKSASGACRNCGQEGHFARECPQGRSGGSDNGCRRCGATDHMVRECPQPQKCFNCGQEGHQSKDCTNPRAVTTDGSRKPPQTYEPPTMTDDEILTTERIHTGINYEKYFDNIKVQVTGAGCEGMQEMKNFADVGLSDTVMENITRASWPKPTPIQSRAIPIIMAGHDLMACAQTGSGKTAAYLLPVLSSMIKRNELSSTLDQQVAKPAAIIIAPTRELAVQISMEARFLAFKTVARVCLLYGGTNVRYQLDHISRGCHILVATPGRLNHIINEGKISLENCRYTILDEADRMLDMGFESEMRRLLEHNTLPLKSERQTLMFSATFPEEIQRLAQDFLRPQFAFIAVGIVGGANTDITQVFEQVDKYGKKERLVALLKEDLENSLPDESGRYRKKTLVFVERKRVADFTASFLSQMEFMATSIHGDREQQQREEALGQFKCGKCPILIATAVAARGLDIVGVDHVINYDLPNSIEDYVHRIGRTGRVGNPGRATSFFDSSVDTPLATQLVQILSDAQQVVPDWLQSYTTGVQSMSTERAMFGGRDVRERDGWNTGSTGNFDKSEKVGTSGAVETWD